MTIENTVFYLIGFPGVGKYTVAQEIMKKVPAKLVDNHYTNNVIFHLIEQNGRKDVTEEVWVQVRKVRAAVMETIATLAPPSLNYILTNVLYEEDEGDREIYAQVAVMAQRRKAKFFPIVLTCAVDAHLERIAVPERALRSKLTDPTFMKKDLAEGCAVYRPAHPNLIEIDVTDLSAAEAAAAIVERVSEAAHV